MNAQDTLRVTKKYGKNYVLIVAGFKKGEGCHRTQAIKIYESGVVLTDTCYNSQTGTFNEHKKTTVEGSSSYMKMYKKSAGEWQRIQKVTKCVPGIYFDWFEIHMHKRGKPKTIILCRLTGDYRTSIRKTMEELEALLPKPQGLEVE